MRLIINIQSKNHPYFHVVGIFRNSKTNLVILIEAVIGTIVGASIIIVITLIICYKKRKVFCKKRNKKNKKAKETNKESMKKHFVESQSNNWATRTGQNMEKNFKPKQFLFFFQAKKGLDHQHVASG